LAAKIITTQDTWDNFVEENSSATLMHRWAFLKTIEKHSNFKLLPYGIYQDEELICIIPIYYKKVLFNTLLFSPPPKTGIPYLGFVFKEHFFKQRADQKETFLKTVFTEFEQEIIKINPSYMLITSTPSLTDYRFFLWNQYDLEIKYTYTLDLTLPLDQLLKNMKDKRRQKISKAKRENIEISELETSDLIYSFLEEKYSKQGINLPLLSKNYLDDLKFAFPDNIIFRIAKQDGKVVGTEALINYKDTHLNWIGASNTEDRLPTNELLIWDYIEKAKAKNIKQFDLAGANNEKISFFKSQFGPQLVQYCILKRTNIWGKILEKIYLNFIKKSIV
jgi:lipid II:glycine glycyltransferase (peptidoglycan interpeptide bridge formation enzyme)